MGDVPRVRAGRNVEIANYSLPWDTAATAAPNVEP